MSGTLFDLLKLDMESKLQCIESLRKKGFTENFTSVSPYRIRYQSSKIYKPYELKISAFYLYGEEPDPSQNSALFAIETNDGKKGILVDSTWEGSENRVSEFIRVVTLARKRNKKYWFFQLVQKIIHSLFFF